MRNDHSNFVWKLKADAKNAVQKFQEMPRDSFELGWGALPDVLQKRGDASILFSVENIMDEFSPEKQGSKVSRILLQPFTREVREKREIRTEAGDNFYVLGWQVVREFEPVACTRAELREFEATFGELAASEEKQSAADQAFRTAQIARRNEGVKVQIQTPELP